MKPFLMGTETEYAVSGRLNGNTIAAEEVYGFLNEAMRQERRWMPDVGGGRAMFLEHGGRFYMDSGGHPEYATPEVSTPAQVAAYDKAGEHLMGLASERVMRDRPNLQVTITKNNIGPVFPDRVTWGCHESHLSWQPFDKIGPQLIPHLVSRTIYCGSGCLSGRSPGTGFELSQRSRHIVTVAGTETTSNRPIFCTRIRKASDFAREGWVRLHLVTKDAQRSPFGIYLTFGATGVLVLLMNEGRTIGQGLQLADPVRALQTISLDPWLRVRVPLVDGRKLTALEIQHCYLEQAERELQSGGFPDWAPEVVRHWRQTLEDLEKDPCRLATRLDPYCKLFMFDHEVRRAGYSWSELHQALRTLETLRGQFAEDVVRAVMNEDPSKLTAEGQAKYPDAVKAARTKEAGILDRLRFALRLQALELKYHELGGLYDQLAAAGRVESVILSPADVQRASSEPPPGGRAAIRGDCVKTATGQGWVCDWRYVFHSPSATFVDLRNPFETERRVLQREQFSNEDRSNVEMSEMYQRLTRRINP